MTKLPVSVIILTYNEEKNIEACLKSVHGWVEEIFVVDSYSNDHTLEITRAYTDQIFQHPFENQARQLNWALENLPINTEWVMRLDADEMVSSELRDELIEKLSGIGEEVSGLYVNRRVHFMGRWIKHGGYYPIRLLRIWRRRRAYCEDRWMDEHMKVKMGNVLVLDNDIVDENKKGLHWWIGKHNSYATREAIEILNLKYGFLKYDSVPGKLFGSQEQRKRWFKEKIYANLPLFLRPLLYFVYRYFMRLGFLDGKEGLIWHCLQGFWYRFLVDAKIYEIQKRSRSGGKEVPELIYELYAIRVDKDKEIAN